MKHKDGKESTSDHCWIGGKRYSCEECAKGVHGSWKLSCPYVSEDSKDQP